MQVTMIPVLGEIDFAVEAVAEVRQMRKKGTY